MGADRLLRNAHRVTNRRDRQRRGVRRDDGVRRLGERRAQDRRLELEVFGQRLDDQVDAGRGLLCGRRGLQASRRRVQLAGGAKPLLLEERERCSGTRPGRCRVARMQHDLMTAEGVLAPDLGAHQPGPEHGYAHPS